MDDFRQDGNENHSQAGQRPPEYSFWAEQVSGGSKYIAGQPENQNREQDFQYRESYGPNQHFNHGMELKEEIVHKPNKSKFKTFMKSIVFGVVAAAAFLGVILLYNQFFPQETEGGRYILGGTSVMDSASTQRLKISNTELGTVNTTSRDAVSQMVENTMPAIVSIASISTQTDTWFGREYNSEGSGSGIIVERTEKELLIATNNHVVEGTNQITVTFIDGSKMDAVIKGTDATADLAVITVDIANMEQSTLDAIEIAKLGDSDKVKVGEMMIAIGNALGYGQSVTVGYVSAKDRKVEVSDNYSYKTMILLQTDAAINPGNSGGALLNVNGEVIGINTVKYSSNEVEGMGYAIPISRAIPIINDLMSREILKPEEQGFLGVSATDVTEEISQMYNIPVGVSVSEVVQNSAADKAGLKRGDIITKINETEITSKIQLSELISSIRTGTEVEVTFMRGMEGGYQEMKVKAVLGVRSN